jgi:indolepyruvate ferredoxin oxidoreductase
LAILMDRNTLPPTQMGGEGMNWTGIAPFSGVPHVFQNLGDGTYFHSGLMAVRGAVTAGVNVTYKILYNDAVAMTGGQRVEGQLSVAEISHQLRAERVGRIVVVTDDPDKYGRKPGFAPGVVVRHRDDLEQVQRELREVAGVTAIIYDQTCAAEKRRRRKRGTFPDPDRRVLINELVCEGCGDCSVQANCLSIEPLETEFGRKRRIDQSSCNKDYSCAKGFCPSFVSVRGGTLRKPAPTLLPENWLQQLPEPSVARSSSGISVLVTGIGGTGVVTVGAVLTMAAHLDGLETSAFDMTGLAQKGGAVFSHLKFARAGAARIGLGEADVVIGCDLVVTASEPALRTVEAGRTRVVYNTHLTPTAALQRNPDVDFRPQELAGAIDAAVGLGGAFRFDGTGVARQLLGDTTAANLLLVGYALQMGWLPVTRGALERAIELNGTAVQQNLKALQLGRCAAHYRAEHAAQLLRAAGVPLAAGAAAMGSAAHGATTFAQRIETRAEFLVGYQGQRLADRYQRLVNKVATREAEIMPGMTQLAEAVAHAYFRLLAYKDEYEVARLHATQLGPQVEATFAGDYRVSFHLAPPLFARKDPATGLPRKTEFGPWILPVFRALARLRFLRGTWLDPFGYTGERRTERQLIAQFESTLENALPALSATNHAALLEWVHVHDTVRGYGHVKAANLERAQMRWAELVVPGQR